LAACRAVLLGLLLPDPCDKDCPAEFKKKARELLAKRFNSTPKSDAGVRDLLLKFVGEFADWDHAANTLYLEIGRGLVKAAHPEETPVVVDPFSGGGSIPLEALRLGCETFASDLNPVACLILKTLLEDIPRYSNLEFTLMDNNGKDVVAHGLVDALRNAGKRVKEAAEKELAKYYPPDPDGSRPIAYLWGRTVRCEGIGCGMEIPLVRSFWLSKKPGRKQALRYRVVRSKGKLPQLVFEVFSPKADKDVPGPTVENGKATCPCCNVVLSAERTRAQLVSQKGGADVQFNHQADRIGGATLLAVATIHESTQGRSYRISENRDYQAAHAAQNALSTLGGGAVPDEPINAVRPSPNARGLSAVTRCGMVSFGDLFTSRQKLALSCFTQKVKHLPDATGQNESIKILLAACVDKLADLSNVGCRWEPVAECPRQLFSRQAIPIVWDIAEGIPIGESSGSFEIMVERQAYVLEQLQSNWRVGQVQCADACNSPLSSDTVAVWFTDPPYYDSIPYADLSDFFYVWLRRALPHHPLLSARFDPKTGLTPKTEECVWNQSHLVNGQPKDGAFFERTIASAFLEGRRVMREDAVACVVFAHKTTEGWEALLSGMLKAGFVITASWPITTEMATRMVARDTAALAGSVHLVCRPRPEEAGIGDWSEVKSAMEKRIREWLPTLVKHGVRGADAIFACLGPALESYSRYDKVLTAADHEVPLGGDPDASEPHERGFLAYVFEAVSKEALRQVLGDAETEGFEEDARMTALFLWTLQSTKINGEGQASKVDGQDAQDDEESEDEGSPKPKKTKAGYSMPFDTFIRLTRPMGIHYPTLEGRVIEIEKGVVRLLAVRERTEDLLGEAAQRPGIEITLEDFRQLEFGIMEKKRSEAFLPSKRAKGKKPIPGRTLDETVFTTLDRIHRTMLLFSLGRSTLLRQVLETEMRQNKRFERLALALNALYPDSSDERRMLEGVQAAMRGVR
jgi:adenine-specific DNA methylase